MSYGNPVASEQVLLRRMIEKYIKNILEQLHNADAMVNLIGILRNRLKRTDKEIVAAQVGIAKLRLVGYINSEVVALAEDIIEKKLPTFD